VDDAIALPHHDTIPDEGVPAAGEADDPAAADQPAHLANG
jgi:hypothetical protein